MNADAEENRFKLKLKNIHGINIPRRRKGEVLYKSVTLTVVVLGLIKKKSIQNYTEA